MIMEVIKPFKANSKRIFISVALVALISIAWFAFYLHYNNLQNRYIRNYDDTNLGMIYSPAWESSPDENSLEGTVHVSKTVGETVSYLSYRTRFWNNYSLHRSRDYGQYRPK
jgi:hypothetical protein